MKVFRLIITLFVLLLGLVIGALNSSEVHLNFLFSSIQTTLGFAIVVSLLVGVLVGSSAVLFFSLIPLYTKLRQAQKMLSQAQADTIQATNSAQHLTSSPPPHNKLD